MENIIYFLQFWINNAGTIKIQIIRLSTLANKHRPIIYHDTSDQLLPKIYLVGIISLADKTRQSI